MIPIVGIVAKQGFLWADLLHTFYYNREKDSATTNRKGNTSCKLDWITAAKDRERIYEIECVRQRRKITSNITNCTRNC